MKYPILCEYMGGSHSYGLATPNSDIDIRGTHVVTEPNLIIDPHSYSNSGCQTLDKHCCYGEDVVYFEIRHYLHLLAKANTQCVEMLFNNAWLKLSPEFKQIIAQRNNLIDPKKLYNSVKGYSFSEYQLAIGKRTGKLGGARQESLSKYGFSPKNWANLLRILYCADMFFKTGQYTVNMRSTPIYDQLTALKNYPQRFNIARLDEMYSERTNAFEISYKDNWENIAQSFCYDRDVATELMYVCYRKILKPNLLDQLINFLKTSLGYEKNNCI